MAAYVIVHIRIDKPDEYDEYKTLALPTVHAFDGKYLVRGGPVHVLEGAGDWERVVLLEFPSVGRAKEWWDSPLYAPIKRIRHATARTEMIVMQGV